MRILRLTIKKKFFDLIASGVKKSEYRVVKKYWVTRLIDFSDAPVESKDEAKNHAEDFIYDLTVNDFVFEGLLESYYAKVKEFDAVEFKNGYNANSPTVLVEWKGLTVNEAVPEWSDNWKGLPFDIHLGKILK